MKTKEETGRLKKRSFFVRGSLNEKIRFPLDVSGYLQSLCWDLLDYLEKYPEQEKFDPTLYSDIEALAARFDRLANSDGSDVHFYIK